MSLLEELFIPFLKSSTETKVVFKLMMAWQHHF